MTQKEDPKSLAWTYNASKKKTTAEIYPREENPLPEVKKKEKPSLGDLNPLIHIPELNRRESIEALRQIILEKIEKYGGVEPMRLESTLVTSLTKSNAPPQLRFIARFEVDHLTENQMTLLERLVKETYRVKVRTRVNSDGKPVDTELFLPVNPNELNRSITRGWYMGPDQTTTDSLHSGLYVFKDMGEINSENFLGEETSETKFIIEVREAAIYQTDLVEFITQVSTILGSEKMLDQAELLYEVYYDLLRLGLKEVSPESVYGMDDHIGQIMRGLIIPLASLDLSRSITQEPESVIMIGVPGTGKTLIAEELLQQETGVFILPIDPLELTKELLKDKEKQRILPRISEVAHRTGKRIILHIDDIENMVKDGNTHSTLLNLMAGVRDSGFYVIASTNEPEQISDALYQPQRFGIRLYCGLQDKAARFEILKIHAVAKSLEMGIPLFSSEEERDAILEAIAEHADYFTPRYLDKITNVAKSYLAERIALEKGSIIGLTEADLEGYTFILEDFAKAYLEVSSGYDRQKIKKRDDQLRNFVKKSNAGKMGFLSDRENIENEFVKELRRRSNGE